MIAVRRDFGSSFYVFVGGWSYSVAYLELKCILGGYVWYGDLYVDYRLIFKLIC